MAERRASTYSDYLRLDQLLSLQVPASSPPQHDELLFIVQHQATELWLKLVLHELRAARAQLLDDEPRRALKSLARVKHVQRTLVEQWSILTTLIPPEYATFRGSLGTSSGFQSSQYRAVEFALGAKDEAMLAVFADDETASTLLHQELRAPSLYDAFLRYLAHRGHAVPPDLLSRDVTQPWESSADLVPVLRRIYGDMESFWTEAELAEELVDLEENFQLWRFRHLETVERTIGALRGTGGSSGVSFLQAALSRSFFPELLEVRRAVHGGDS